MGLGNENLIDLLDKGGGKEMLSGFFVGNDQVHGGLFPTDIPQIHRVAGEHLHQTLLGVKNADHTVKLRGDAAKGLLGIAQHILIVDAGNGILRHTVRELFQEIQLIPAAQNCQIAHGCLLGCAAFHQ